MIDCAIYLKYWLPFCSKNDENDEFDETVLLDDVRFSTNCECEGNKSLRAIGLSIQDAIEGYNYFHTNTILFPAPILASCVL